MSRSDFFAAIRSNDLAKVASLLNEHRALANARIRGDATLLNEQIWVEKRPVAIPPDDDRDTPPLHYAAFTGNVELAKLLVDHGADLHALGYENNHESTPAIVLAAWEGGIKILRLLLECGADPNSMSSNGVTPLSTAMRHRKHDRVALLRQYGATDT